MQHSCICILEASDENGLHLEDNLNITLELANIIGYSKLRGINIGLVIFSNNKLPKDCLIKLVDNPNTSYSARIQWVLNIPTKKNITCFHTYIRVLTTPILEFLFTKLNIEKPEEIITYQEPNKETRSVLTGLNVVGKILIPISVLFFTVSPAALIYLAPDTGIFLSIICLTLLYILAFNEFPSKGFALFREHEFRKIYLFLIIIATVAFFIALIFRNR